MLGSIFGQTSNRPIQQTIQQLNYANKDFESGFGSQDDAVCRARFHLSNALSPEMYSK